MTPAVAGSSDQLFYDHDGKYAVGQVPMAGDVSTRPGVKAAWRRCLDAQKSIQNQSK